MLKATLLALLSAVYTNARPQDAADSIQSLREVEITATSPAMGIRRSNAAISISSTSVLKGPRALGQSDALGIIKLQPGVASGSDYASGISVNGMPLSQTSYTIDGAPVFFPYHFGGIFSTFNTPHYNSFTLDNAPGANTAPMRIGSWFDASTPSQPASHTHGVADIGILASSLSVAMPCGANTSLAASARISYIDALCSRLVDTDHSSTRYNLHDGNITMVHRCDSNNIIKINALTTRDKVRFIDNSYSMTTHLRWSNSLANACWLRTGANFDINTNVWWARSDTRFGVDMPQLQISMPSGIEQYGARAILSAFRLDFGASIEHSRYRPQSAQAEGYITSSHATDRLYSWQYEAHAYYHTSVGRAINLDAGARLSGICADGKWHLAIDPRITATWQHNGHSIAATASIASQYMQQVGLTNMGLATNFWLPPVKPLAPLRAYGIDVRYDKRQLFGNTTSISATIFAKAIQNEAEYRGMLLSVLTEAYSALDHIDTSNGFNTGATITMTYTRSRLTVLGGYALAICRRHFSEAKHQWLPAASEPMHSLKINAQYAFNGRLKAGAFFTLASGARYTPVEALYIIAENVITEYGQRNSARLPLYHRLDLTANYQLRPIKIGRHSLDSFINFSLINAYGRKNVQMQYYAFDATAHTITLHQVSSLYRFLPSISYTLILP